MKSVRSLFMRSMLSAFLGACSAGPSAPIQPTPPELANAPTEIVIANSTLRLTSFLYRNFQPGPAMDTRIIAPLRIESGPGQVVPAGVRVQTAWIILGDEAWISTPRQERPPPSPDTVEYVSRGGPEWPIGALLTAVVEIRDANNVSYLLRGHPQRLVRVE